MELDRTEIVIRQRSGLELLDLSLLVLKRHFVPLLWSSCILGLPLIAIDLWLIHWMVTEEAVLAAESSWTPELAVGLRYCAHLIALFTIQFSMISLPATMVLGSLVFYEPMPMRTLLTDVWRLSWRWLLILGVARLGLLPFLLEPMVYSTALWDTSAEVWLMLVVLPAAVLIRMLWPFASEIIGLERCSLRRSDQSKVSYRTRSRFLHGPMQADLISRFVLASIHAGLLLLMLLGASIFLQGVITGSWQWTEWFYVIVLPACLMLVGMLMTVFRYLSYIDNRIQLEGWEIELRMRAEAFRLQQQEQPQVSSGASIEESLPT